VQPTHLHHPHHLLFVARSISSIFALSAHHSFPNILYHISVGVPHDHCPPLAAQAHTT
jgi:hypothetical protein